MTSPTPATREAQTIAAGGTPTKTHTVEHPVLGPLAFVFRLPRAQQVLEHSIALDERLASLSDTALARNQTLLLAAALAGLVPGPGQLIGLPVVDERPIVDDGEDGHTKTELIRYDPEAETDPTVLIDLWLEFSAWRNECVAPQVVDAVKGPSGETTPDGSGA